MRQVTNNTLLVGCVIFLLIWVNIDLIYHILPNGSNYAEAKREVFLLSLSQLLLATFSFTLSALNYGRYYAYSLLFSLLLTVSAIVLNNNLIPVYGMYGAAWSNLLSYALYFALIVFTVSRTMRLSPFCRSQGIVALLFVGVLLLNSFGQRYLPLGNIWWSSVIRSTVLIGGFCYLSYRLQLSPEINAAVQRRLNR